MSIKKTRALIKRDARKKKEYDEYTKAFKSKETGKITDINEFLRMIMETSKGVTPTRFLSVSSTKEVRSTLKKTQEGALNLFIRSQFERFEALNPPERLEAVKELKEDINRAYIPFPSAPEGFAEKHPKIIAAANLISKRTSKLAKKKVIQRVVDPEIKKIERSLKPKSKKEVKPVKLPFHPKKDPFLDMARNISRFNGSENQIPELRRLLRKSRRKGLSEEVLSLLDEQARKSGYRGLLLPLFMDERKKLTEIEKKFFGIE